MLITFSGLDGSGKSTQIGSVRAALGLLGYRSTLRAFWDHVVVGARYREGFVHKVYRSERGVGAPGKPVARRDKNVRRWYLTLMRHLLYLLDAIHLDYVVARERRRGNVLVMDRYIYDELANLPLANRATQFFVRAVTAFVPRPDIAYLLDADPDAAVARKPEYPVEFMRQCRESYFELARQLGNLAVIPPLPLEKAREAVLRELLSKLLPREQAAATLDQPKAA
jgi:thymidylate kinase